MDWYFGEVFEADIEITFADNEPPGEKTPRTETPRTGESTRISSMLEIITESILSNGLNLANFTSHCSGANQEFVCRSLFLFAAKDEQETTEKINAIAEDIARKLSLAGITMTRSRLKVKQAYRRERERGLNVHNFEKI